jgi:hypothetical protein
MNCYEGNFGTKSRCLGGVYASRSVNVLFSARLEDREGLLRSAGTARDVDGTSCSLQWLHPENFCKQLKIMAQQQGGGVNCAQSKTEATFCKGVS